MLQIISLLLLAFSFFVVQTTIPRLPAHIPVHYNAAGLADGWGSPDTLWALLAAQALTCVVFLVVPYLGQRIPSAIHFGSRRLSDFPPEQRPRMLAMLNDMAGYLGVVMNLFFVVMLRQFILAATAPVPHLSVFWPLLLMGAATLGIIMYYFVRFSRAALGRDNSQ